MSTGSGVMTNHTLIKYVYLENAYMLTPFVMTELTPRMAMATPSTQKLKFWMVWNFSRFRYPQALPWSSSVEIPISGTMVVLLTNSDMSKDLEGRLDTDAALRPLASELRRPQKSLKLEQRPKLDDSKRDEREKRPCYVVLFFK